MTQRAFLTSAVLSAASGQLLCQPDLAFGLMHSLTGRRPWSLADLSASFTEVQADLLTQFPWIADLDFPDLAAAENPRRARWNFLAAVCTEHGSTLPVTVRVPVEDIPAAFAPLPAQVRYVRLAR